MTGRKALRVIHRWLGLISALWLLMLAATGLLLQQTESWGLSNRYVSSTTILTWFDYGRLQQAYDDRQASLYQIDDVVVFGDHQLSMPEPVVAAKKYQKYWLVATRNSLYWLRSDGQISQKLDDFDGLPTPIEQLQVSDGVRLKSNHVWYELQQNNQFVSLPNYSISVTPQPPRPLTQQEQAKIIPTAMANRLSYDTIISAIHGGAKGSSRLNTISALALIFLSVSGIIMFFKPKRRGKQRR